MVKTFEQAIAEVARLPDSDQEQIGRKILSHVEKLRQLRGEIDKGHPLARCGQRSKLRLRAVFPPRYLAMMHRLSCAKMGL